MARRSMSERNATLSKLERVPKEPPPAEESVNQIVSSATACENPRHRNRVVSPSPSALQWSCSRGLCHHNPRPGA